MQTKDTNDNKGLINPLDDQSSVGLVAGPQISAEIFSKAIRTEVTVGDRPDKHTITKTQLDSIVQDVSAYYETTPPIAYLGICCTLQAGGSNNNKRSNVKITIGEIGFESKKINQFITKHCQKLKPRQFARVLANDIYQISVKYRVTGNAYMSLKRLYPDTLLGIHVHERYWAADFQFENPSCPSYIREALRKRYVDKFIIKN